MSKLFEEAIADAKKLKEVAELENTKRGSGGFGSTGIK